MFSQFFYQQRHRIMFGTPIVFLLLLTGGGNSSQSSIFYPSISDSPFLTTDSQFSVHMILDAKSPVNVVSGSITYPNKLLMVKDVDYRNSMIDLWAESPVVNEQKGTIDFSGGITSDQGFRGHGEIFTVTFIPQHAGNGAVQLTQAELLARDGVGTPLDYTTEKLLFSLRDPTLPSPDINGDGAISLGDINTIYLATFRAYNKKYDLNGDGKVSWSDLLLLLNLRDEKNYLSQ